MTAYQKKIIKIFAFIVLIVFSIFGLICYILKNVDNSNNEFIQNYAKWLSFFSFLWPVAIGFFVKYTLGVVQKKQIEELLEKNNINVLPKEKQSKKVYKINCDKYFSYDGIDVYIDKDRILLIDTDYENKKNDTPKKKYTRLNNFLNELNNKIRIDNKQ